MSTYKTISEKIFSDHLGRDVEAGEIVIVDVDFMMGQDGTTPLAIKTFENVGAKKVANPEKVAFIIDHNAPSPSEKVSALHKLMRDFSNNYGTKFYDIGEGICHQLIPEKGHALPGQIVIGADSHTCTYGAINCFSTGVGSTDLAIAMASGKLWFKVPQSVKIVLEGSLSTGVYSKDVALYIVKNLTANGATYKAVEFEGPVIDNLSVEARFTISNMSVEMGAKVGLMKLDEKAENWVKERTDKPFKSYEPDEGAKYEKIYKFDVSDLEPQIAEPHAVDNVSPISEVEGVPIHQGLLGTCTNGRIEDLRIAASILKGKKIHNGVRLIVAPSSKDTLLKAMNEGIIQTLVQAGATVVAPGCGPCVGTHNGVPSDGENVISTANRNFKGRMGNNKAFIYLGSPATVAASCIEGKIADPRKYL
ncbi:MULTISPECIES: 3-isopropylmalate dehydratase large subunit [Petrotoga]|uniref:3-isopropylmalate dehydratase large subunit n=2 Tax=Petrotoga sibirica TaxID=156202 RepID=A0A4R8EWV7_9BACT|nr:MULTISPECIES: 3-isopropylmalate dehydratase large subunit [Petrotoga]KUK82445.1 MAG: 3-isopropylmalate dehydratase large subunit [Petrotoga mobilis]POZ88052.1 3-isopropylmalate dehydratase [Petrotoga sibirica DSM 13575]POZ90143.1 3-isopropylmalate dehydratase [Petrotoga sp. SL27]TDX17152.1 3-isopropylmalate/(R)-2-methylmalate dehydratase large subunit [Petrotoga sibirica]